MSEQVEKNPPFAYGIQEVIRGLIDLRGENPSASNPEARPGWDYLSMLLNQEYLEVIKKRASKWADELSCLDPEGSEHALSLQKIKKTLGSELDPLFALSALNHPIIKKVFPEEEEQRGYLCLRVNNRITYLRRAILAKRLGGNNPLLDHPEKRSMELLEQELKMLSTFQIKITQRQSGDFKKSRRK